MKKLLLIFFLTICIVIPINAKAESVLVSDSATLKDYFTSGGDVKLGSDISFNANTFIYKDIVLDLNGHTLNMGAKTLVPYANVVVVDTSANGNGKITNTGTYAVQVGSSSRTGSLTLNSGSIDCGSKSYCVSVAANGNLIIEGGTISSGVFPVVVTGSLEMNSGSILALTGSAVYGNTNSTITLNNGLIKTDGPNNGVTLSKPGSKFIMNGGKIEALSETGAMGTGITAFKDTEVIINNGDITSTSAAIMGNGSISGSNEGSNAKFTINGGLIKSTKALAIYAPQVNGENLITGGTIEGATSGIEIRAGKLTVTGGTIIGNSDKYELIVNTNGSNITGAAISVVQHTTKQPIEVNIEGGTFVSNIPLIEQNALDNSAEDVAKISINISDGLFISNNTETVSVEDFNDKFITGGTFSTTVTNYVKDNYGERVNNNNTYTVLPYRSVNIDSNTSNDIVDVSKLLPGQIGTVTPTVIDDYDVDVIITDEDGNKIEVNNNQFIMPNSNIIISVSYKYIYKIIEGANQTYKGSDIIIKSNGDVNKLLSIKIDNDIIDEANYSIESGSTILTLKSSYLKSLSEGEHKVSFIYDDGSVSTNLNIERKGVLGDKNTVNPKTNDNVIINLNILTISLFFGFIIIIYIKNNKKQTKKIK